MLCNSPLYRDPIYDGAADPMIIRKESDGKFYMFYTQRRANQQVDGVSYAYGTNIGVAESDNGAQWHYRGALDLDFEFGHHTYWAPEIVYNPAEQLYHMFVSYIVGIYTTWDGQATIEHYTSKDLFYWDHVGKLEFNSSRIIDPCLFPLPEGGWRMWYKDERQAGGSYYADSPDLYHWEYRGNAVNDCAQEGPNVFELGNTYWLISDVWDGLGVYSSHDLEHFTRQPENILREAGTLPADTVKGRHADVFAYDGRTFIVYFTHSFDDERTVIHLKELTIQDGKLVCDRNTPVDVCWQ